MLKYILFDFDGTLVDSREAFIKSFNQLAFRYNFKKIEAANLDHLKALSMMERFHYLNVPLYRLPFLTMEFSRLYRSEIGSVSLMPGIPKLLEKISGIGLKAGIVSSNSNSIIESFVVKNAMQGISDIYCSGQLFGKDRVFRKFLKEKKFSPAQVVYVCDELRDVDACKKVGIKPVWVSWGYEREEAVNKDNNLCIAHSPEELFAIIDNRSF
jgi:phosphoglycolate phosphatase